MNGIIVFGASDLYLLSVFLFAVFALYLWLKARKHFFSLFVTSIVSFPLAYIIAKIAGHFIYNTRPFVVEHIKPLIPHAANNGFPSDHTLFTMTIAAIVFDLNKKLGIFLAVTSILVGVSRVLAGVHHIEDIIGSIVIAFAATFSSSYIIPFAKSLLGKK